MKKIIGDFHYKKMYNEIKKEVLNDIVREGVLHFLNVDEDKLSREFDIQIQKTILEDKY